MKQERYKHLWTDCSFLENIYCNYVMLSYTKLGKPGENIIYYESMYIDDDTPPKKGSKIPIYRNVFTINEMIEEYQRRKDDIDSFTGQCYPENIKPYIANPYLILDLSSSMQSYHGWLNDGYPFEKYTLTEIKRLVGAYN